MPTCDLCGTECVHTSEGWYACPECDTIVYKDCPYCGGTGEAPYELDSDAEGVEPLCCPECAGRGWVKHGEEAREKQVRTMGGAVNEAIIRHERLYPGSVVYSATVAECETKDDSYCVELRASHFSTPCYYTVSFR